jgi:uncharacterized linocin/CFP29 family protein
MSELQMLDAQGGGLDALIGGSRPLRVNSKNKLVQINTKRGLTVNSLLREDEWQTVDGAVMAAARYPLKFVNLVRSRGLVQPLGGLGTMISAWYASSEVTQASVNMTGRSRSERDLPDLKQFGVPIPVIFKEFSIGERMLLASRNQGDGIDVTAAAEAARVVAEQVERIFVSGAGTVLNGAPLYGITNHPNRNTDTATNYGGGSWATITNIVPTVNGMINAAMSTGKHYGPYTLLLSTTQYNLAANSYFTDGSGQTALDRIKGLATIEDVVHIPVDILTNANAVLIQMSPEVIDAAIALDIQVREWASGDGMESSFKVLAVMAPRVKARYDGKSGIVHATGL